MERRESQLGAAFQKSRVLAATSNDRQWLARDAAQSEEQASQSRRGTALHFTAALRYSSAASRDKHTAERSFAPDSRVQRGSSAALAGGRDDGDGDGDDEAQRSMMTSAGKCRGADETRDEGGECAVWWGAPRVSERAPAAGH